MEARQSGDTVARAMAEAYSFLDRGDLQTAEGIFQQVVEAAPGAGEGYAGLAAVAAMRGEWSTTADRAREALRRDSTIPSAAVLLCRAHVATGQLGEAISSCEMATELDPSSAAAFRGLCAATLGTYRWSAAARHCDRATVLGPDYSGNWWRLGVAHAERGEITEAEPACARALALGDDDPMAAYCQGVVSLERQAYESALQVCSERDHALLQYCRGMAQLGLGNHEEARTACERAVALAPGEALAHFCLGRVARAEGRWDSAASHLRTAIDTNAALTEARGTLGDVLTSAGQLDDGERWLREALRADERADRYAQLALNLYRQERYSEAIVTYTEAIERAPSDPALRASRAAAYSATGQHDAALADLEAAVAEQPENPRWSTQLISTALAADRPSTAFEHASDALSRHANHAELHALRCQSAASARLSGAASGPSEHTAVAACRDAAETAPRDARPQAMLGVLHLQSGDAQSAETALRAAIGLGTDDATVFVNLGNALLRQGRARDAVGPLGEATERAPDNARAHFMLGTALAESGSPDAARRAFCRAAELAPENDEAQTRCSR